MIQEKCVECEKDIKKICYSSKKGWVCSKCNDKINKDEENEIRKTNSTR